MAGQGSGTGRGALGEALRGIGGIGQGLSTHAAEQEEYQRRMYRQMQQEANARYVRPNIRDEVVLRTLCGCEKIVSMAPPLDYCDVRIDGTAPSPSGEFPTMGTYHIRRFRYNGDRDGHGRPVLMERLPSENWELKYKDLHEQVYGMDRGL